MNDTKRAFQICRIDVESCKGEMIRRTTTAIKDITVTPIPPKILDLHPTINLSSDYFFVQGIAFLYRILRSYTFHTIEHLLNFNKECNQSEMEKGVKTCIHLYYTRGLRVTQSNTDNEFTCTKESITTVCLNIVAAEEHVGEIERPMRTVKEDT